jgi:hypothetical protein
MDPALFTVEKNGSSEAQQVLLKNMQKSTGSATVRINVKEEGLFNGMRIAVNASGTSEDLLKVENARKVLDFDTDRSNIFEVKYSIYVNIE